jgi:hypothetical protein
MTKLKVAAINVLVFAGLLIGVEFASRTAITTVSCLKSTCDFKYVGTITLYDAPLKSHSIGLSRLDPLLGYVPREGFSETITYPGSGANSVNVTILENGFRSNDNNNDFGGASILAVGDSMTFGDQVSNSETWPSCLERTLNLRVDNGGVFGYGAAQSLRRAILETKKNHYTTVILSVLIDDDFKRDGMKYRSGFPKPSLIVERDKIVLSDVSDPYEKGTKFNPSGAARLVTFFYQRSVLVNYALTRAFPNFDITGARLTMEHPKAAGTTDSVNWVLANFSNIEVERKVLLMQYMHPYQFEEIDAMRAMLTRLAKDLNIQVVDTANVLDGTPADRLWNGHHTPQGNAVVCQYLARALSEPNSEKLNQR